MAPLTELRLKKPARNQLARDAPHLVAIGMVAPVGQLRVSAVGGGVTAGEMPPAKAKFAAALRAATHCVQRGWWPFTDLHDVCLTAEGTFDYTAEGVLDAALGSPQ